MSKLVMYAIEKDIFFTVDIVFPTSVLRGPSFPADFVENMFTAHSFSFVSG